MIYEIEYNARSIPPSEVAQTFIPPESHFLRLLSRDHTLLLGPRGSGKTTLLKMLTLRALSNWKHPQAASFAAQVRFNAAFVPADIAWGKQMEALGRLDLFPGRRETAFVLQTLRSLVYSMREACEIKTQNFPGYLQHLTADLPSRRESELAKFIANSFRISPPINSLMGIELAFDNLLNRIGEGDRLDKFGIENFWQSISTLVSAFNSFSGQDERRWALLFDEIEIAPKELKHFLLSGIRSVDGRIVVKIAIAPYMEDMDLQRSPTSPHLSHDYHTVQLTYPNKSEAIEFGNILFRATLHRFGISADKLEYVFEADPETQRAQRNVNRHQPPRRIPLPFPMLAKKDQSFREYVEKSGLFSAEYKFTEEKNAQFIRKILPIVIARDYYLKKFENGRATRDRSRKSLSLYTGYPAIVEVAEGNPRSILTLVGPLAQRIVNENWELSGKLQIPISYQNQALQRIELLLTSLLRVIPLDVSGFKRGHGLLDFVDSIGRAFATRLLRRRFSPDYMGTFTVDDKAEPRLVSAVGKALNAGAFVHVPHPDSGPDILYQGLRGQRFRVSYTLAPRYRLLLTLGAPLNLSTLLSETSGIDASEQLTIFGGEDDQE